MEYKYKFSVIMPIYNVEAYLEEAIKSIINQSIGFEENIQLILVNDGSPDKSEFICNYYKEQYPENIIYIKQENQGVSSARNKGLQYAEGKYINFIDSDDKWDYYAFDTVYDFFEENKNEIDVVACRQKFFEASEDYHKLDYKFDENKIVDIQEDYDHIQLSAASAFIKLDILKNYQFDTRIKFSEDATLMGQILMEKQKYGILSDVIYYYRRRKNKNSAIQTRDYDKSWYNETLEYGSKVLIQDSIKKFGSVIPYIQYQIMYDIQWRLKKDLSLFLQEEEKEKYINKLKDILKYIDDNIIIEQKFIGTEYKILVLSLKYGEDIRESLEYRDGKIYFKECEVYGLAGREGIKITKLHIQRKSIVITGRISYFLPKEDYKLYINRDGENYPINNYKIYKTQQFITKKLTHYREFKVKVPIETKKTELYFIVDYKGNKNKLCNKFDENGNFEIKKKKVTIKKWGLTLNADRNKIVVKKN